MCDDKIYLRRRPLRKNVDDGLGRWNYHDVPRPKITCGRALKPLCQSRPDCSDLRTQCILSSVDGTQDRLTDKLDAWEDSNDPYNNTATGFLGVRRKSMLNNPLLVKHKIGSPFQCCRRMPCADFIYGSLPAPSYSAALALGGWSADEELRSQISPKQTRFTNFLALNRAAITAGVCGHGELRDFRNTHRIRFNLAEEGENEKRAPPITLDPDATFGRPTRYITTAAEIMSGQEQKDWLRYVKGCTSFGDSLKETKINPWKENHACTLRMFKKPTGLKPDTLWHMPKFERKAKPSLSTFRKMADEINAHNANSYEKVGRDGMFGQGIPTKASNRTDALSLPKP